MQMDIWMVQKIAADYPNCIAEYLHFRGALDGPHFLGALHCVAREASELRCNLHHDGVRLIKYQRDLAEWVPDFIDVSTEANPEATALSIMRSQVVKSVDMRTDALFRWCLIRLSDEHHIFFHAYHHIVMDGVGYVLLLERVAEVYRALRSDLPLPVCRFATASAIVDDEVRYRASEQFAVDRAFWQARAALQAKAEPPLPLSGEPFLAFAESAVIPEAGRLSLKAAAERLGVSLSRLLSAAIIAYFRRWDGQNEMRFRLAVSARSEVTMQAPGYMAHALPLQASFTPHTSLADIVRQLDGEVRCMRPHIRYRAEDIVRDWASTGGVQGAQGPVINIMPFSYAFDFGECRVTSAHQLTVGLLNALEVAVHDRKIGDGLHIDLYAPQACGSPVQLQQHVRRLARFIEVATAVPQSPIDTLPWLDESERRQLLEEWSGNALDLGEITLAELFEVQATRQPNAVALEGPDERVSYGELDARANRLASHLQSLGVGPDVVVGVCLERSIDMVVAILGIAKAGAAYLPLAPDYPTERLAYMLTDSMAPVLLTESKQVERLPSYWGHLVKLDRLDLSGQASSAPARALRPDHLAYVIYTSGSTGQPKGVAVSHAGLAGLVKSQEERFAVAGPVRVLQFASLSFDAAVMEILMAFCSGGRLVLPAAGPLLGEQLEETLNRYAISHALIAPSALETVEAEVVPGLSTLVVGGETCSGATAASWSQGRRMVNAYGPTEATVCVTMSKPLSGSDKPKLGRPTLGAKLYVLDSTLQPVPVGVAGELYIAGRGLARGYYQRPGLTAERFVANPYGKGERLYRSGDLAHWSGEGELEYLGRVDQQLKIRGFRIEPGEIETVLCQHPQVREAVVVSRTNGRDTQLVGYVTIRGEVDGQALRRQVANWLPEYMVPAVVLVLEELPRLPNGKLDHQALPAPEYTGKRYQRPRNAQEEILCGLFAEVLEVGSVGIDDSFFDLGGHSLLATRLISRIRATMNIELSIRDLFECSSVASLSRHIVIGNQSWNPYEVLMPIRASGNRHPLFCIHPEGGLGWSYIGLALHLDHLQPIYTLQARGLDGVSKLASSIRDMAADYIQQIRTVQPDGPYHLLGWSLGGLVAQEMAVQLERADEKVALLAILDTFPIEILHDAMFGKQACAYDIFAQVVQDMHAMQIDEDRLKSMYQIGLNHMKITATFSSSHYRGDLLLFRSTIPYADDALMPQPETWSPYISGILEVHEVECTHMEMMQKDVTKVIGQILKSKLSKTAEK
ncbi:non-ribosomal peptide synthase (plasmid) [Candidatus Burkholderia crenata]|nr:non-ribosomal peptide synthase [Candidatus Burkholderia crenata]